MWPFSNRGSLDSTQAPRPDDFPDFKAFETSGASLKVWLPNPLVERLNWMSKELDVSRPNVIRGLLFEHLYGRPAYEALKIWVRDQRTEAALVKARTQLRASALSEPGSDIGLVGQLGPSIVKSTRRATFVDLQEIGKSLDDLTVEIPIRMKEDLTALAEAHDLTPSSYVRKMLVLQLMGEGAHTRWQIAVGAVSKDVLKLEKN